MKVKICGVTHPHDAEHAAKLGADYIGILFSGKRQVTVGRAREIARAARSHGAEPVGVFVDAPADVILDCCREAEISIIQIHRGEVPEVSEEYAVFYAIPVQEDGSFSEVPSGLMPIFDSPKGGSGKTFNWELFTPPKNGSWMLAGGLNPQNVGEAIAKLRPSGVDVSSGVEVPDSVRKDPRLVEAFIREAKQ